MPAPKRRGGQPWGYTRPLEVRGAFIRALSGVLTRRGQARRCALALDQFCREPFPMPAPGEGGRLPLPPEESLGSPRLGVRPPRRVVAQRPPQA